MKGSIGSSVQASLRDAQPFPTIIPWAEYLFSVGSTGDPPVPSGDPPDGTGRGIERKGTVFSQPHITAIPPGGSPGGAGGSPAPPTLNRYPVRMPGSTAGKMPIVFGLVGARRSHGGGKAGFCGIF